MKRKKDIRVKGVLDISMLSELSPPPPRTHHQGSKSGGRKYCTATSVKPEQGNSGNYKNTQEQKREYRQTIFGSKYYPTNLEGEEVA